MFFQKNQLFEDSDNLVAIFNIHFDKEYLS